MTISTDDPSLAGVRVLVVAVEPADPNACLEQLQIDGFHPEAVRSFADLHRAINPSVDVVVVLAERFDDRLLTAFRLFADVARTLGTVMIVALRYCPPRTALEAMKLGADMVVDDGVTSRRPLSRAVLRGASLMRRRRTEQSFH